MDVNLILRSFGCSPVANLDSKSRNITQVARGAFKSLETSLRSSYNILAKAFKILYQNLSLIIDQLQFGQNFALFFQELRIDGIDLDHASKLAFCHNPYPKGLIDPLKQLHDSLIFSQDNVRRLITFSNGYNTPFLTRILKELNQVEGLTEDNFIALIDCRDLDKAHSALGVIKQLHLAHLEPIAHFHLWIHNAFQVWNGFKFHWALGFVLKELNHAHLLTRQNFDTLDKSKDLFHLLEILTWLNKAKNLTQKNFEALYSSPHRYALATHIKFLHDMDLLVGDISSYHDLQIDHLKTAHEKLCSLQLDTQVKILLVNSSNPILFADHIHALSLRGLLTQSNIAALKAHSSAEQLARSLLTLDDAGLLNESNLKSVLAHEYPISVAAAFEKLKEADLFHEDIQVKVQNHIEPYGLALAFIKLHQEGLLDSADKLDLAAFRIPELLVEKIIALKDEGILNDATLLALKRHKNPILLTRAFIKFHQLGQLNQANLNRIANYPHLDNLVFLAYDRFPRLFAQETVTNLILERPIMTSDEVMREFFLRIPDDLLTQAVIEHVYNLCAQEDPLPLITAYFDQLLEAGIARLEALAQAEAGLNVHEGQRDDKTVAAIKRLYAKQHILSPQEVDAAYQALSAHVDGLEEEKKNQILRVLNRPRVQGSDFGPLVSDTPFSINGYQIFGKELAARLWKFTNDLKDPHEKENAKVGMMGALIDCIEADGHIICNQGKTQRLICAVLQGRLEGVNVEGLDLGQISKAEAMTIFFLKPERQIIESLDTLLQEANKFCDENPTVNKDEFLKEIRDYAKENGVL